ncbi:MAG: MmcB family DNA repair protein [Pseudomonadota bacterium]
MNKSNDEYVREVGEIGRSERTASITRGVRRHLAELGWEALPEFTPERGRRLDLLALNAAGRFWAIEVKSSLEDLRADQKWEGYRAWCDALYFAVDADFPMEALPPEVGVICADAFGAEIVSTAPEHPLASARRQAQLRRFARQATARLRRLEDPTGMLGSGIA